MAKCAICEKGVHYGNNVSHSHRRSNHVLNFKGHPFGCPFYLLTYMKLILLVVLCLVYLYIVEIKVIIFPL